MAGHVPDDLTIYSLTRRLRISRPTSAEDEETALLRAHPDSRRYLPFFPAVYTAEDNKTRREERAKRDDVIDFSVFLVKEDGTEEFVGITGLIDVDWINRSCSVGILISSQYHRQGIATEAIHAMMRFAFEDEALKMHRCGFETGDYNVQMRGWLENVAGAKLEGISRESWKDGDKWVDMVRYGVLDREWEGGVKDALERWVNSR
jgi:RimJ/RimL family protein N-acetyltransferase